MSEEITLVIAGGESQYRRWLADNQLLGKKHLYRHIKDEEDLFDYWDNKIICVGVPRTNSAYNSLRMGFIRGNYEARKVK